MRWARRVAGSRLLACLSLIVFTLGHLPSGLSARPALAFHTINADDRVLRLARDAGAQAVLQLFPWSSIEPAPGEYFWEYPDFVVRACEYYGLKLVMRLDHPPSWAMPPTSGEGSPPVDITAYGSFVRQVASRYRGRVAAYVIWNEPNLAREWGGQPPDPAGYAELLGVAYEAVKTADPAALVVSAGLAPTNQVDGTALDDRDFLRGMLAAGAGNSFDVFGAHPYGFGLPPTAPVSANDGLNVGRLTDIRRILVEFGLATRPIWITEVGWTASAIPEEKWMEVSDEEQADYLTDTFDLAVRQWPWVDLIAVWNLTVGLSEEDEKRGYSVLADDGEPRPAYRALAGRFGAASVLAKGVAWASSVLAAPAPVEILASDVTVRLGDRDTAHPHWARIHGGVAPSRRWEGTFYVSNPGKAPWRLTMQIMQVEEGGNLVRINGHLLHPPAIPRRGRPDYTSVWTLATMTVPVGVLRPGANTIEVLASPRLPAYQDIRYESLQFRDMRLEPGEAAESAATGARSFCDDSLSLRASASLP